MANIFSNYLERKQQEKQIKEEAQRQGLREGYQTFTQTKEQNIEQKQIEKEAKLAEKEQKQAEKDAKQAEKDRQLFEQEKQKAYLKYSRTPGQKISELKDTVIEGTQKYGSYAGQKLGDLKDTTVEEAKKYGSYTGRQVGGVISNIQKTATSSTPNIAQGTQQLQAPTNISGKGIQQHTKRFNLKSQTSSKDYLSKLQNIKGGLQAPNIKSSMPIINKNLSTNSLFNRLSTTQPQPQLQIKKSRKGITNIQSMQQIPQQQGQQPKQPLFQIGSFSSEQWLQKANQNENMFRFKR